MGCSMDHRAPESATGSDYPVGRCPGAGCRYAEPHRHGSNCDKTCACAGVGAETAPLSDDDIPTCDWGGCNRDAVATRRDRGELDLITGEDQWLSVCSWHAGWDDAETPEPTP